jgi:O-acetyl-ADP-ribose deacetylase (regulator of RNase III)
MEAPDRPRPGANDYALILAVVGEGFGVAGRDAERRANVFLDWVLSPLGGGLPGNHVHALIGDEGTIGRASLRQMLYELIPDLDERVDGTGTAGRRCYVYLAGQAIDVGPDICLIARDESNRPVVLDASLRRFTNYLRVGRVFDEVIAFGDVGLQSSIEAGSTTMAPSRDAEARSRGNPSDAFVAFGRGTTRGASRQSQAQHGRGGDSSFDFTQMIIGALSGGARDDSGAITTDSLHTYLSRRYGEFDPVGDIDVSGTFEILSTTQFDTPRLPDAHALLIGIDKYITIPELNTCASDARALAGVLVDPRGGGYSRENVHLLTNYSATRAEVVNALAQLSVVEEGSTVFIYFSGRASAASGEITLWCSDDDPSNPSGSLTASRITEILDSFVSKHVVLVLDTSEGAVGMTSPPGRIVLSATLPGEAAYMNEGNGEFTLRLLQGLQGAAGEDDDITIFDLFEGAHLPVVAAGQQHPTILRDPSQLDFVIAKRPLEPTYSNRFGSGGRKYDVYVVFSLQSPRAEFVEHVVLPALRAANLAVAISEPLATSPVGRVMGVDRGIRLASKTLMLVSPALQSEFQYGVVVDSLYTSPPILLPENLVVVDLEAGVDDIGQGLTWEEFDLIPAKTARHSSVKRLIERLRSTPDESANAAPNTPLVEIVDERDRVTRDAWLLPARDSEWVMKIESTDEAPHASSTLMMHPRDVAFAREQLEASRVLGMTLVRRVFKSRVSPTPTGRVRSYQLERPLRFEIPKSLEYLLEKGATDGPQMGAVLLEPVEARMLAAMCIASNPLAADRIAEWTGVALRGIVFDACMVASRWNPHDRDHVLPGLLPHLDSEDLPALLGIGHGDRSIERGAAARAVVRFVRQTRPDDLPFLANLLRDRDDPVFRALAASIDGKTKTDRYAYSAFIDISADVSTYGDVASRVVDELNGLGFGPAIVEASTDDGDDTGQQIRNSACVVLGRARTTHAATVRRQYVASLNAEQRTRLFTRANVTVPKTIVLLDPVRESYSEQRHVLPLPAVGLAENSEGAEERVVDGIVDAVLAASQSLTEAAEPPPRRSRSEAMRCIELEVGDLVMTSADAIVNAVGVSPMFTGSVGRQLYERLGERLTAPLERARSLDNGETVVVETNAHIPARYVINTCTEKSENVNTAKSVARGVNGAILAAESQPDIESIAFPALGSGASNLEAADVAREVLPTVLAWLEGGTFVESFRFVFQNELTAAAYREVLDELQDETTTDLQAATRWFVSLRQTSPGSVLVGGSVSLGLFFAREELAGTVAFDVPHSALELTIYVDAGAAFHLAGPSQLTVQAREGEVGIEAIPIELRALTDGTQSVRVALNVRGGSAASSRELTDTLTVDAAVVLPDIPELIDPRAIPTPEPDFLLYVAFEETRSTQKIRLHVTCASLGLRRQRLAQPLYLSKEDVAAIQLAAAEVAAEAETLSPPDARATFARFGAMLYDVLMPLDHELRQIVNDLFVLPQQAGRPFSWLVVSDEAASLPWELVCPYGIDSSYTRRYGDFLAAWFAIAQWIGRRGFELATEVPMGPIGIVHYGQQTDARARLRDALDPRVANDADRTRGLDILRPGSPYFGVHLLRFTDPMASTEIAEAGERTGTDGSSVDGDRRLDFTLRRPLVTLSFVDSALDDGGPAGARFANLERAWAIPMLLARVSAVVGPRWTTSPEGDRTFYRAFYDALRADRPVGVALWEARDRVRAAHPARADWLAYSHFGHPAGAPYPVEEAEGFAMFEPIGMEDDEGFVAGRTYAFRASFRSEPPAWFGGRRRRRVAKFDGEGTRVVVDAAFERAARTFDLVSAGGVADDYYCTFEMTMPQTPGANDVFVQFARAGEVLRSMYITFDVLEAAESRLEEAEARTI